MGTNSGNKAGFPDSPNAILAIGDFHLFLDSANHDSRATVGFVTDDCDRDYTQEVLRGAKRLAAPEDQPYGACGLCEGSSRTDFRA
jgi:hypothetical protein